MTPAESAIDNYARLVRVYGTGALVEQAYIELMQIVRDLELKASTHPYPDAAYICPGDLPKCKWIEKGDGISSVCFTCGDSIPF